ncbi:MAG TPA: hypothetical protein VE174_14045 [Actinomycetota bacterium]|nr:hypothetical protein [Actinomycetota bacterium]
MIRAACIALVCVATLVLPVIAGASHQDVQDPLDTRGPLDVRSVKMTQGGRYPRWVISTWDSWKASKIFDRGYLLLEYDTLGDRHFDYYALIRSTGGRLSGTLHRDYDRKSDRRVARLHLSRPGQGSVRVRVPLKKMTFKDPFRYRWKAHTLWSGRRCVEVCIDRVPDSGSVTEPRPVPTPTPTVTITPTPTDTDI